MPLCKYILSFIILLLFFSTVDASANNYLNNLTAKAIKNKLYENPSWIALLSYRKKFFTTGYHSQADTPDFFLSPQGISDPKAELISTITGFFDSKFMSDQHPQCRFPARFQWLKQKLKIDSEKLPAPDCTCLNDWKKKIKSDKATIVFPASYLNNPSSMFGHLFLRLDASSGVESNPLMAYTVNFAADTSSQQGTLDYAYKGLLGGFPNTTKIQRFHQRFKTYSDIENRDIWEYQLNLTQSELDQLILHIWELQKNPFDYYFFDENCAYRQLSLLAVARPDLGLSKQF
ncbi:MAG: DUF4105 domain-containing protein, partial [Desulfobacteraceae bacterium]